MDVIEPPAAVSRVRPANQLFLIVLLLLLTVGAPLQAWRVWPGEIFTELCVILLPTLLFARKTGSTADALRLRWAGLGPCWLGLGIGVGAFPLAAAAGALAQKILGYSFDDKIRQLPTTEGQTAVYLIGSVLLAPLCEEMMFRGYILTAYQRTWRPHTSIPAVTVLFAAFHLSAARFPVVLVLGLAITYVAWRTGSIWPAIAVHMGANGAGAVLVLTRHVAAVERMGGPEVGAISILVTVIGALCLARVLRLPAPPQREMAAAHPKGNGWGVLAAASVIVLLAAAGEFVIGKSPNLLTKTVVVTVTENQSRLMPVKEPWTAPAKWRYEIDSDGKKVGDADYEVRPDPAGTTLLGTVRLAPPRTITFQARWDHPGMLLRKFSVKVTGSGRTPPVDYHEAAAQWPEAAFRGGMYSPYELPWRLEAATILDDRHNRNVITLAGFREAPLPNEGAFHGDYRVEMDPKMETVEGLPTVKLKLQDAEAWYDAKPPHPLVRYRDGVTEWRLVTK